MISSQTLKKKKNVKKELADLVAELKKANWECGSIVTYDKKEYVLIFVHRKEDVEFDLAPVVYFVID